MVSTELNELVDQSAEGDKGASSWEKSRGGELHLPVSVAIER